MDPRKLGAEALGTFWLVLGGCGSAVLAAGFMPDTSLGIGLVGVSLAFGLTVLTGAYALGHVSGGHFNPAVTLGLVAGRRFPAADAVGYVLAQVLGAIAAAAVLAVIATGVDGFELSDGFASNGFDDLSPGGYSLLAALVTEVVMTAMFLVVIMGATRRGAPNGTAPVAIGLALTLIHLISIPVTNTSVNPARSTGPALFAGGDHIAQLWLFWLAPIVGAVIGAVLYRSLLGERAEDLDADITGDPEQSIG
ncbi:aquaporin Z [Actinomarinicola tropica]|uniref:Aquaporin Z n=1 Tax=Actinomarinicola tropica TaxID=2789776 RepID=A0A5Q2RP25_9ACTN|nr:aquaporin Z [Actinomarinicola tropica]QGG94955.1 aquaporin Z [Actinomarinicola tropica]